MKRGTTIFLLLLLVMALLVWKRQPKVFQQSSADATGTNATGAALGLTQGVSRLFTNLPAPVLKESREEKQKRRDETMERALDDWRTPIEFYGRVVDETGMAVVGATIYFGWNDLSAEGHSTRNSASDSGGVFSLTGIHGKGLSVRVEKAGYYTSRRDRDSFMYAGDNVNFVPNPDQPVTFHLRKRGQAEALVTIYKSFQISKDGTPVFIDLINKTVVPATESGIKVECRTEAPEKRGAPFNWKCRISVPGGGLQPNTNEFGFLAPDGGYVASDEMDMTQPTPTRWQSFATREYFVRTGNGRHGRLSFRMVAGGDHFCFIEGVMNPSGSRNLEFDPAVQLNPTQQE